MMSTRLGDWMADLPEPLWDRPLVHLAIPGTHDSLSWSLNILSILTRDVAPDAPNIAKQLNKYLGPFIRTIMYRWSKTQSEDITGQLKLGIRYFDLRAVMYKMRFLCCHSLYGGRMIEDFKALRYYLDDHKKEIVVLDVQHMYEFEEITHQCFKIMLDCIFKDIACPRVSDINTVTLRWLWEHGYQVIVIYRDPFVENTIYWRGDQWLTPWPNTTNIDTLIKFLDRNLKKRPANAGYVSQCVLTPSVGFIVRHLYSTLKKQCGIPCDQVIASRWIDRQKCGGTQGLNVVIADFVTPELASKVLQLNYASI